MQPRLCDVTAMPVRLEYNRNPHLVHFDWPSHQLPLSFFLSGLPILWDTALTSGQLIGRQCLRSTEVSHVCLAFNEKLEMRRVREEGVWKGRQVWSWASCDRCKGKRKFLEGNEKSTPGNTHMRRQEELINKANLNAVLLEDTASVDNLQSQPSVWKSDTPTAKRWAYQRLCWLLACLRKEGERSHEQTSIHVSVRTSDQHQVSSSVTLPIF